MSADESLTGSEVALTGHLASMTRSEAVQRITKAGGRHVREPGPGTSLLVAGQAAGHLTERGGIEGNMIRFRALKQTGSPIRLIEEPTFVNLLGAEEAAADFSRLYTAAQVSRIVETPLAEVRSWIRRGLLQPARSTNRLAWFEFKDILSARKLSVLRKAGVATVEIRRSLSAISEWLPDAGRILERLESFEHGLRVRLSEGGWAEPGGQQLIDFSGTAGMTAARVSVFPGRDQGPDRWLQAAIDAEDRGDSAGAAEAYARVVVDAPDAEALFSLGNALYELGRDGEAAERYLQAIGLEHDFAEAWNNLGNSLVALGKHDDAVRSYETALSLEPAYPDAHCNLATILERVGQPARAYAHRVECERSTFSPARLRLLRYEPGESSED